MFVNAYGNPASVEERILDSEKDRILTLTGARVNYPADYGFDGWRYLASIDHEPEGLIEVERSLNGIAQFRVTGISAKREGRALTLDIDATSPLARGRTFSTRVSA